MKSIPKFERKIKSVLIQSTAIIIDEVSSNVWMFDFENEIKKNKIVIEVNNDESNKKKKKKQNDFCCCCCCISFSLSISYYLFAYLIGTSH